MTQNFICGSCEINLCPVPASQFKILLAPHNSLMLSLKQFLRSGADWWTRQIGCGPNAWTLIGRGCVLDVNF